MKPYSLDDFAVMSVQYIQHSFEYYLESMKRCNIKHIDLWGGEPHFFNHGDVESRKRLLRIKKLIDDYEMDVVVYTPETLSYPYSYSHPDYNVRLKTIEYMKKAIDDAITLNCDKVFMNSGCGLRDIPKEESFERMIESIRQIVHYAQGKGITIVLEQLQPYESNLIINKEDLKRVIDVIDSPNLKICIDVVAMEVANETLKEYFELFSNEKIDLIHFSDSHHYVLGQGERPYPLVGYLQDLIDNGYDGIIDLEINDSIYWMDPHASIDKSTKWLQDNLQKLTYRNM